MITSLKGRVNTEILGLEEGAPQDFTKTARFFEDGASVFDKQVSVKHASGSIQMTDKTVFRNSNNNGTHMTNLQEHIE